MVRIGMFIAITGFIMSAVAVPRGFSQGHGGITGLYDSRTVQTFTGTVIMLKQIPPSGGLDAGIEILLQKGNEIMTVIISPGSYLVNQGFHIQVNDPGVSVTGSRISLNGSIVILAAQVINGNQTLILRDSSSGIPAY